MSTSKLWPRDSEKGKDTIKRYLAGEADALVKELGYANKETFTKAMRNTYGIKISEQYNAVQGEEEPEPIIFPAPEIKIRPLKQEGRRGQGEEVHLQPISDCHCGLLTPTYNVVVFKQRLKVLMDTIVNLCQLHRKMRPIKELVVPFLGDIVQGEQYGVQGFVEEYEIGAIEQIYDVLVPEFANFFVNLLQVYPTISVYGVEGNHGNIQRKSQIISKRSNWDIVFYRALKQALAKYSRIQMRTQDIGGEWYQVIEVNGWRFLIVHGDMIVSYQGVPFYGIEKRGLRWKQSIGINEPFDYVLSAHLHNPNFLWNAGVNWWINGCFVTDSKFPLTRIGLKDVPIQWSLFVNRKYGVTANYRIKLGELK